MAIELNFDAGVVSGPLGGAGGTGHRAARTDVRDDRAPPEHHQGQRHDLRGGAGSGGGGGHAPAAAGDRGRLPPTARPAGRLEVGSTTYPSEVERAPGQARSRPFSAAPAAVRRRKWSGSERASEVRSGLWPNPGQRPASFSGSLNRIFVRSMMVWTPRFMQVNCGDSRALACAFFLSYFYSVVKWTCSWLEQWAQEICILLFTPDDSCNLVELRWQYTIIM